MYRAYQPLFPAASRYLQEKWDKASYQEHCRKVESAIPVVDTAALPTPLHLQRNLKKKQLEKECQAARDQANLLHYARLEGIKQSRGRVDNWNFYHRHSLNWEKHQRDLERIYRENWQLLRRLEGMKSELAQGRWQQDWHREQQIRNRLARYPRGTRSCQAGAERRTQRTGCSSSPTSACGKRCPRSSPNRTCLPSNGSRPGGPGKRFWGSGKEPALEGQVSATAFSPSLLRKRGVAQRSSRGACMSARGFATKDAGGPLARADVLGGVFREKPMVETRILPTKTLPSICLKEKCGFLGKILMPASKGPEKKRESSAKLTEPCYGRTKEGSEFDGFSLPVNPTNPSPRGKKSIYSFPRRELRRTS